MKSITTIAVSALFACSALAAHDHPRESVQIIDEGGEAVGLAELTQGPRGTVIRLELEGLEPGPKAIHIHGTGTCADHDHGFQDSGGHLNPQGAEHGLLNPQGPGAGDLPNFYVHEDGRAWAEFYTTAVSLDGAFGASLSGEDGTALVIHENPDDHTSQPIGGAGSRVACGVIHPVD